MEGMCILLQIEPIKVRSKDGIGFSNDYWLSSTGKYLLGNPKLIENLSNFDINTID